MNKQKKSHATLLVTLGVGVPCLVAATGVMVIDRLAYNGYEIQYEQEAEKLRSTFPALPKSAIMDNDYVTYSADGSTVASTKSSYGKSFIYYARDAVIAPLSQDVAQKYEKTDDSLLGEYITGLDRRGGAITFTFRTPTYGNCDIEIALKSNYVDEKGVYHDLGNITDFIKIQTNGLDVKTENLTLTASEGFQHLILKDAFLLKGENTLTFTTSAYNDFGNKDSVLYVMPDIRNVTVLTDADVYTPVFEIDTSGFQTSYRLVEIPDLTKIQVIRKIGDPEVSYEEKVLNASAFASRIDYDNGKIILTCSKTVTKEIPISIDKSKEANTIQGTIEDKPASIVVTSPTTAEIDVDGAKCTAKISLGGKKGLARITLLEKTAGEDAAFNALPKSFGIKADRENKLLLSLVDYYMSTTKANSYSSGSQYSQTGNTYFAITNEEFLTAFWNWTYEGDECLTLKCTYSINEAGTSITLNSCLEYSRNEWQYLTAKTFTVSAISSDEVPQTLLSRLHIYE